MEPLTAAVALDIGTTRIKGAHLDRTGTLSRIISRPAPESSGQGLIRECSIHDIVAIAESVLSDLIRDLPPDIPVGIATQRSSFVLWKWSSGKPVTPVISWQDRRALPWCRQRRRHEPLFERKTGLRLSPHYAGPKLAAMFEGDKKLAKRAESGDFLFGTLETYLIWKWTEGQLHETDISMAARTLMVDLNTGDWDGELLRLLNVPRSLLPAIGPTLGKNIRLNQGGILTASVSDQAAGLWSIANRSPQPTLINLGTGGFVLASTANRLEVKENYLSGPIGTMSDNKTFYAIEGTINAINSKFGNSPVAVLEPVEPDPLDGLFCIPDDAGIGAPYWQAEAGFTVSASTRHLKGPLFWRLVAEGIVFRIREIIEDIEQGRDTGTLYLSGGVSKNRFIQKGLAACLARPVFIVHESELTLLGIGRLAAGMPDQGPIAFHEVGPEPQYLYLQDKYAQWKTWVHRVLGNPSTSPAHYS